MLQPNTVEQAAQMIREHSAAGKALRARGGGTKLAWTAAIDAVDIDTRGLNRILEHNAGDFTAVLEAGVRLNDAQAAFARTGQMLALDPPLGADDGATIGGVIAANDSGPLRHRYGAMRDLVIGITVVLSDGTIAKSGGQVIKNVAGYDLAKLYTGSFGTLGLIARAAVRLHPLPMKSATVIAHSDDAEKLTSAVLALARLPLEADSLDVNWSKGSGKLLVRFAGGVAEQRARIAAQRLAALGRVSIETADNELWAQQRALQRSADGVVIKVSGRPTDLTNVLRATDAAGATLVSRGGLGLSWIVLPAGADHTQVRKTLAPRACTVLDGAARVSDPWPAVEPGALAVMKRVKARFDPARSFAPGVFVGGI